MTEGNPFDALLVAYEQGQRDAIAAAVQRIEALLFPWPNTWPGMIRRGDVIDALKDTHVRRPDEVT